jgi:hypothetical protein
MFWYISEKKQRRVIELVYQYRLCLAKMVAFMWWLEVAMRRLYAMLDGTH